MDRHLLSQRSGYWKSKSHGQVGSNSYSGVRVLRFVNENGPIDL